jgi:hypothetical protein
MAARSNAIHATPSKETGAKAFRSLFGVHGISGEE